MAMRDFHTFLKETNKTLELPSVSESGSARRAGVRSHAYPIGYNRSQYTKQDAVTHAADAAYYVSKW